MQIKEVNKLPLWDFSKRNDSVTFIGTEEQALLQTLLLSFHTSNGPLRNKNPGSRGLKHMDVSNSGCQTFYF